MPRPRKKRKINFNPNVTYFKPRGVPMRDLGEVSLTHSEAEALRLYDHQGLSQTEAAKKMDVSQSTFQRTIKVAHKKVAKGLIEGKAIKIDLS
ncbi:MAG: DUF134 domain-containing protein [Patescibacteria group bacterium]